MIDTTQNWKVTPEKIEAATRILIAAAQPSRILLFGSQARGDAGSESDADLLVVKPRVDNVLEENFQLRIKLMPLCLPMDLILTSTAQFEQWRDVPGTVCFDAAHEGRVLYETTRSS